MGGDTFSYWILADRHASLQVRRRTLKGIDLMILSQQGSESNRNNLNFGTTSEFCMKMKGNRENLRLEGRFAKTSVVLTNHLANK
jgi:hypothetical protein